MWLFVAIGTVVAIAMVILALPDHLSEPPVARAAVATVVLSFLAALVVYAVPRMTG